MTSTSTGRDDAGESNPAPLDVEEVAAVVANELAALAVDSTREWWTAYLKGSASFRGVKMAGARRVATETNELFGLGRRPVDDVLDATDRLMAAKHTEDKLVGVLLLAEHHLGRLETGHLDRLAAPLAAGHLGDWNSCDWYCVKVLGPFVAGRDSEARARGIAAWRHAESLWQRRAAAVAFVGLAPDEPPFDGFDDLLLAVAAGNAADPTRWSQTSVGWLLRELSRRDPDAVAAFVAAHDELLSTEARRTALARIG